MPNSRFGRTRYVGVSRRLRSPLNRNVRFLEDIIRVMDIRIFIIISSLFLAASTYAATIKIDESKIIINGVIEKGDHLNLIEAINVDTNGTNFTGTPIEIRKTKILINSPGGDALEAMKMGNLIRENKYGVDLFPTDCFSACVYILAAGLTRNVIDDWSQVGIHRPYFDKNYAENTSDAYQKLIQVSEVYFKEMNINPTLAEDMFSIPSGKIKILDNDALTKYRLNQDDMVYNEMKHAQFAEDSGLSRDEYIQANKRVQEEYKTYCIPKLGKRTLANIQEHEECVKFLMKKHGLLK